MKTHALLKYLPIIFFFIAIFIFFFPVIIEGKLPVPSDALVGLYYPWRDLYARDSPRGVPFKNFLITDPVRQLIPWRKVVIDEWKTGKIPTWNPYSFSGASLVGNGQAAIFYPLNLLFFILPFADAWAALIVLEPLLAGLFFYLYVRSRDLDPWASLFGSITWSFSGFAIAWLTWGTIVHVALWLPLALLAIDKVTNDESFLSLHSKKVAWLGVLIVSLCSMLFAGHLQVALYCIGVSIVYACMRLVSLTREKKTVFSRNTVYLMCAFFIFLLVTSIQWIPFLHVVQQSSRITEISNWTKPGWFLPWQHLVQFVVPDFFGNPTTLNYWGEWNYGEFIGYVGIVGLVFVFAAIFVLRSIDVFFWIGVGFVCLLFMLPTPLAKLPFLLHMPVIDSLQPTRLMVIVDFSLALLAAYGMDHWIRKEKGPRAATVIFGIVFILLWIFVSFGGNFFNSLLAQLQISRNNLIFPTIIMGISVVILYFYQYVRSKQGKLLLLIFLISLALTDQLRFGWKFTPFTPREYFFPTTKVIAFLQKQPKPFRVMSTDPRLFPPNVLAYYGIESIDGYDPIIGSRYEEFIAVMKREKPDITPPFGFNRIVDFSLDQVDSPFLFLLNVQYILSLVDISSPKIQKVFQEGETRVYKVHALPSKAFFAYEVISASDRQDVLDMFFSSESPVSFNAIVEEKIDLPAAGMDQGTVQIHSYDTSHIVLGTVTTAPRFLVISQIFAPGWKAYIDGAPTHLYRTDYLFQGVVVPTGNHMITLLHTL